MLSGLLQRASSSLLRQNAVSTSTSFSASATRLTLQSRSFILPSPPRSPQTGIKDDEERSPNGNGVRYPLNFPVTPWDGLWNTILDDKYISRSNSSTKSSSRSPEEVWRDRDRTFRASLHHPADAYSGRSVQVQKGDVGEAYMKLEHRLRGNHVKQELKLAERHEKKGDKRRRLKSERWRKRFAHEVRKKVQLVNAIRKRGA